MKYRIRFEAEGVVEVEAASLTEAYEVVQDWVGDRLDYNDAPLAPDAVGCTLLTGVWEDNGWRDDE